MRVFLASTVIALTVFAQQSSGDGPKASQPIPWTDPFEPISASVADALVLVLITNEDPYIVDEMRNKLIDREEDRERAVRGNPPVWCADVLAGSYRKSLLMRPDLNRRLTLQSIAAGLPKEITGGQPRNTPARAVLAICDGNYRLLAFTVGVPDTDQLLTMIEDAEEVRATFQSPTELQPSDRIRILAERSSQRLSRLWRNVLDEVLLSMDDDPDSVDKAPQAAESLNGRMQLLGEALDPTYDADVRLRFGFSDVSDRRRLIVLEQHVEARRPWCESMIPFVAGTDFSETWRDLVQTVWGHRPITHDADATELVDWFDLHKETNSVVLSLEAPFHVRHLPWPPITESKRGIAWHEVHETAMMYPFRTVAPQQLAVLVRSRDLRPIDIQRPSLARYILVKPGKKTTLVIRESDPPGRFAGILKRSKSNLVPK